MRPRVICHMASSVDGRILPARWGSFKVGNLYEQIHNRFEAQAWLVGRVTMEKDFTRGLAPEPFAPDAPIGRADHVADTAAVSFAVAIDAHGKLGYQTAYVDEDHIVAVLTEQVPDAYLAYLKARGISYLFGGRDELDFALVLDKLGRLFPIQTLMLEGGGHVNGSFLKAGLVDEVSLLLYPVADGDGNAPTTFEQGRAPGPAARLSLTHVEQLEGGILWLRYGVEAAA